MITLPVGGAGRFARVRHGLELFLFAASAIMAAAVVGAALGVAGAALAELPSLWHRGAAALAAGVAALYGIGELLGAKWWVPQRHWLVPKRRYVYGPLLYAGAFGATLGAGLFTKIPFMGYHLLLASCVATADPWQGGALMALFGAARAAPVVAVPLAAWTRSDVPTPAAAHAANRWFAQVDRRMAGLRGSLLLALAGALFAGVLPPLS